MTDTLERPGVCKESEGEEVSKPPTPPPESK